MTQHQPPTSTVNTRPALFALGQVCATPGALALLQQSQMGALPLLQRHMRGDWGKVGDEDAQANQEALKLGLRLLSSYDVGQETLWIITEEDRSVTTLLLPEEY